MNSKIKKAISNKKYVKATHYEIQRLKRLIKRRETVFYTYRKALDFKL